MNPTLKAVFESASICPSVMGIINLSPASFSPVGRVDGLQQAVAYAKKLAAEGAHILDVGAEPTNPISPEHIVSEEQELALLIPFIHILKEEVGLPISVDTSRPRVMQGVVAAGADMINDVRALRVPGALEVAAALDVPICLMHMRHLHLPGQQQQIKNAPNQSIMLEIQQFLQERIVACEAAGISRTRLFLDPGIGSGCFGKNTEENLTILRELSLLKQFGLPLLAGASRKHFIGEILSQPPEERLAGSLIAAIALKAAGCHIIRVHDVKETIAALAMAEAIYSELKPQPNFFHKDSI